MDGIDLLEQMTRIPSLSGQERALAELLVHRMTDLGFSARIDEVGNAIGFRCGGVSSSGAPSRDIVLLGHMDTVGGWIPVRRDEGRLYGRGTVDAKGPLAAFITAVARCDPPPGIRLVVIGAVEEESATSRGALHIVSQYSPAACVIGEPSGWNAITLGYKGRLLVDYSFEQPVGHTAGPTRAVAEEAVEWWTALQAYALAYNEGRTQLFDQLVPSLRDICTQSDGLTERVEATVGLRLPVDVNIDALQAVVARHAGAAAVRAYAAVGAYRGDSAQPLARAFRVAIRTAGASPRLKLKTGTSDMNIVGPVWKCPIVAYGPGDSTLDHTPNEHIEIEDFDRAVEVLRKVLESFPDWGSEIAR